MRFRTIMVALLVFAGALAFAADDVMPASKPEARKQIIAVVEAQLVAFRAQDPAKAYSYASAGLRHQMPIAVFAAIVRENYAEIWTNTRADYGIVRDNGSLAKLLVHVEGKRGSASYDYTLEKERGQWRIRAILRHEPAPGTEF